MVFTGAGRVRRPRRDTFPPVQMMQGSRRRGLYVLACLLLGVVSLTGCASQLERALRDQRGTEVWNSSSDAFKEIMRRYVHGDNHQYTDAELNEQFEAYLTLDKDDVDDFVRSQSCLPRSGSGPARYYTVNATHQRHDAFYKKNAPTPLTGEGQGKTLKATFTANLLLERHEIAKGTEFPSRAGKKGNLFTDWDAMVGVLTDGDSFNNTFHFRDPNQGEQVFGITSNIDWSRASGELYIAPKLADGKVFSPALFAVFLLRETDTSPFSVYLTVSANAAGDPEISYIGLIQPGDARQQEPFFSDTRFKFTPLSDKANYLDYELVMTGENPTSYELWMTLAFPAHANRPYLTVRSIVAPTVSEEALRSYTDVKGADLIMMIRKGALMRDLVAAYYPDASELKLWEDVKAIKGDKEFKNRMEAAGLTVGADLFESHLWLQRPSVVETDSEQAPEFEAQPGMDLRCGDAREGE